VVNYRNVVKSLKKKAELYDALLINVEKQNECLDINEDLLLGLQEEWLKLSTEINGLDMEINKDMVSIDVAHSEELVTLLGQLQQKADSIKYFNALALGKVKLKLECLKKELDGVKLGQQTAGAYKMVPEAMSTYIDKKS